MARFLNVKTSFTLVVPNNTTEEEAEKFIADWLANHTDMDDVVEWEIEDKIR